MISEGNFLLLICFDRQTEKINVVPVQARGQYQGLLRYVNGVLLGDKPATQKTVVD